MSNARLGEPSTGIHESFTSEDTVGYTVHMHEMPVPERLQASTKVPRQRKAASGQPRTCDVFARGHKTHSLPKSRVAGSSNAVTLRRSVEPHWRTPNPTVRIVVDTAEGHITVQWTVYSRLDRIVLCQQTVGISKLLHGRTANLNFSIKREETSDQIRHRLAVKNRRPNRRQNSHHWLHLQST